MVIFTVFKDKREGGQRARCVRRWRERGKRRDGKIDDVPKIDVMGGHGKGHGKGRGSGIGGHR